MFGYFMLGLCFSDEERALGSNPSRDAINDPQFDPRASIAAMLREGIVSIRDVGHMRGQPVTYESANEAFLLMMGRYPHEPTAVIRAVRAIG